MSAHERVVAVVTGATGGMGRVIALSLARRGMHVVAVARDPQRTRDLRAEIEQSTEGALEVIAGNVSHRAGITAVVDAVRARHDSVGVLINNAGAHYAERRLSPDGIEMHIAVDYLAAYGLTALLAAELRRGRARVVNVASDTLRDTRQVKLMGRPRPSTLDVRHLHDLSSLNGVEDYVPFQAYARAKLLTVTAGYALARKFDSEATVNAVHPGIVATGIVDDLVPAVLRPFGALIRRTMLTPEQGAVAALRLATDPGLRDVTGRYFVRDIDTVTPPISYRADVQTLLRATTDRFFGIDAV